MAKPKPPAVERRKLSFKDLNDVMREAEKLMAAERDHTLTQLGNWTLGQTCGHLGRWIDFGFDGTPLKVSWFLRLMARPARKRFIFGAMHPGGRLPGVPEGTLATQKMSTQEGFSCLKKACARLKEGGPSLQHPVFGKLTHREWTNMHLRHAELHFSFLRPE